MKTYEVTLTDGSSYELRLTSSQLDQYISKNFKGEWTPLPAVMHAMDRVALRNDLLDRALKCGAENPKTMTGEKLVDALVDDGYTPDDFARLIVEIADVSGIVPDGAKGNLLEAMILGKEGVHGQMNTILQAMNGTAPDTPEPAAEETATPTK